MTMLAADPKRRFSNRVDDYVRYRPGYPAAILETLREDCGLRPESVVADVGSGTGLLARMFLENGNLVYGVEPNAAMREAGEQLLENYPHFCSVAGSAEATTLLAASVDFVVAGQAFHWFEPNATRQEFERILRPKGWVALIANRRIGDARPFEREYELLLRTFGTDYAVVAATYPNRQRMAEFFGEGGFRESSAPNQQLFDFDGLRGRLLSSSYSPPEGHPNHEPMLAALKTIFDAHQENGRVRFDYETSMYYGQLEPMS